MKFSMKSIARNARKLCCVFGKKKNDSHHHDDAESDQTTRTTSDGTIPSTNIPSIVVYQEEEHREEPVNQFVVSEEEAEQLSAAAEPSVNHDDEPTTLPLDFGYAHNSSFEEELAAFESSLMSMECPKDTFEDDFDAEFENEIKNIQSEMQEDNRDLTLLRLNVRFDTKMEQEQIESYLVDNDNINALELQQQRRQEVDESRDFGCYSDDVSFVWEVHSFESRMMSMPVSTDCFEEAYDKQDIRSIQSELKSSVRDLDDLEQQLRFEVQMLSF